MNLRTLLGIAALIFFLLSLYLWNSNSQLKKANTQQTTEMAEMAAVQAELEADYQEAIERIEALRSDNEKLNALIESQKEELKAQKAKVSNLIWTKRELDKAREEIAKFEGLTNNYLAELTTLRKANEQLTMSNEMLTKDVNMLTDNLTAEKTTTAELRETKAVLMSEKENLSIKNAALSEKVDVGSAIKINWMSFSAGDLNDKGEFKSRKRTGKRDLYRTCFKTETNVVTPAGEETFYLRIMNPSAETLAADDLGSGTLVDKISGETMRYTISGTLTYNNDDTEACMDWNPNFDIASGTYNVQIYNKGYMVGQGSFKL